MSDMILPRCRHSKQKLEHWCLGYPDLFSWWNYSLFLFSDKFLLISIVPSCLEEYFLCFVHLTYICLLLCICKYISILHNSVFFWSQFLYHFYFFNCIYFCPNWVFTAAQVLSLSVTRGATLQYGLQPSQYVGFSCCRALALFPAHELISCRAWTP